MAEVRITRREFVRDGAVASVTVHGAIERK